MGTVALFGEAERGAFGKLLYFKTVQDLSFTLGNPPEDTIALGLAVQALMFRRDLIFVRVENEGFSKKNYLEGLHLLDEHPPANPLAAICLPGVGDKEIVNASLDCCRRHKSVLMMNERDLYDFLTDKSLGSFA